MKILFLPPGNGRFICADGSRDYPACRNQHTPMATSQNSSDGDHGFQIAPMVDVVFVLLLFFMALAGLRQQEVQLKAQLPGDGTGTGEIPLILDITADGRVSVNGTQHATRTDRELSELAVWLQNLAANEPTAPFVIRPNNETQHERFIQVLSLLKKSGFRRITFA